MRGLVKAELLKIKGTSTKKIPVIVPIIVLAMVVILTGGAYNAFAPGAWNWWYTLFLEGSISLICYQMINREKKKKYHTVFQMNINPEKIWISKIIVCAICMLVGNLIVGLGAIAGGIILGSYISVTSNVLAVIVLTTTSLWMIPCLMFLAAKFGLFACVFGSIFLSLAGVIFFAPGKLWWAFIPAIPIRMMCPILTVLPNGLPVPEGSALMSYSVVLPGIAITVPLFIVLTIVTAKWFGKREER